ncbi:unnamed protein product [Parajaminaea phylloscopi]
MKLVALIALAATAVTGTLAYPQAVLRRDAPRFDHLHYDGNAYLNKGLSPAIFHNQGQYSGRFTVPSKLSDKLPAGCKVTMVNSLERHGARYMTSDALEQAQTLLKKLQKALSAHGVDKEKLPKELRFLDHATVPTNTGDLVPYGALQAYLSGRYTAQHYAHLAKSSKGSVFVRTGGTPDSDRVIVTAEYWSLGFSGSAFPSGKLDDGNSTRNAPALKGHHANVVISEAKGQNNTLDVSTCEADKAYGKKYGEDGALAEYGNSTLVPRIGKRLKAAFAKAGATVDLNADDILALGNLCAFNTGTGATVSDGGRLHMSVSPFCSVLKEDEWQLYGYAVDAGKYWGSGYGDPYHKAIASGYLRELLARLTSTPVIIDTPTAINTTLDAHGATTFPIPTNSSRITGPRIFFDGSHDNNMSPIAAAFGLFHSPHKLSTKANAESTKEGKERAWRFSHIAPLQGKIVWEKVECSAPHHHPHGGKKGSHKSHFYVRVRANEAVQKAHGQPWCPSSSKLGGQAKSRLQHGLCPLDNVVQSLDWVKSGKEWAKCFAK